MLAKGVAIAAAVALLAQPLWGQAPLKLPPGSLSIDDSALPALAAGSSSVSGRVILSGSTAGIGDATVTISMPGQRAAVTTTDRQGGYTFSKLPAGTFSVSARKEGFLAGAFGQVQPTGAGQTMAIGVGESRTGVEVRLWQFASLQGVVELESRRPMPGATVRALRRLSGAGVTRWVTGGETTTDAAGRFLIAQMTPGAWMVAVDAPSFASIYFPGAATPAMAVPVALASGEQRPGIDFTLVPANTFTLRGRIVGSGAGARIALGASSAGSSMAPVRTVYQTTDADGRFVFASVAPGDYELLTIISSALPDARSLMPRPDDEWQWARAEVPVVDRDVDGVELALHRAPHLSGRVVFDGTSEPPAKSLLASAAVFLEPADGIAGVSANLGPVDELGRFVTSPVLAGRYVLRMSGTREWRGWWLWKAASGTRDLSDESFEVADEVSDITITFTSRPSQLVGSVSSGSGAAATNASVLIFPTDPVRWTGSGSSPRRLLKLRVDAGGRYQAINLPAGAYCVVAIENGVPADWNDADYLLALRSAAQQVRIDDRSSATQNLRAIVVH